MGSSGISGADDTDADDTGVTSTYSALGGEGMSNFGGDGMSSLGGGGNSNLGAEKDGMETSGACREIYFEYKIK